MRREPQRGGHHSDESQEGREEGQSSGLLASLRGLWRRAAAPSGAAAEDNEGASYPGTRSSAYQRQPAAAATTTTQRRSDNNNADDEWVLLNGRQPAATNENMSDEELARALQEQWEREAEEENRRTAARDALVARRLQNLLEQTQQHQEQGQTSSSSPPPRSRAQIEEDEALARRLQAEIEQSQNSTSSSPYSAAPRAQQHSQPYVGPFGILAERATGPRGEQVIRFSWGSNNRSGAPPRSSSTSAPSLFGRRHLATEEEGDELAGLLGPYAELFQLIGMLQRQQAARATGREYGDEMGGSGGVTYEDLMSLAERLGDVNRGVDQRTFEELPTFSYQQPPKQSNNDEHAEGAVTASSSSSSSTTSNSAEADEHRKQCIICLSDFEEGETLRTLPCLHVYHQACIDHWLRSRNTCPICKYEITRR
ncbi:E3 ubiquitin-protein ligase RNF43 [Balamuthia mandrillaris]